MDERQTKVTLEKLVEAGLALSPEGVGIWLTAQRLHPKMTFPSKPWGKSGNPLDNLQSLAKALKESSSAEETKVKSQQVKSGSWNPKLHFVWDLVLAEYASGARASSDFEHFWKVAVDGKLMFLEQDCIANLSRKDNLFAATASRERKYWGFLVLQKVLQNPPAFGKLFGSIFSHNLVRCIINHVQQEDRFLNRAADRALQSLVDAVEANPGLLPTTLPRLISGHGAYNFDKITKTKTIEKLLGAVDDENVDSVIQILTQPVQNIQR
jgi:DNA polymerase phi